MTKQWARDLVQQSLPDVEVVEKPPAGAADAPKVVKPERPGPSTADLRRKYLGVDAAADAESSEASASISDDDADVEVVHVRIKRSSADPADDPGIKTVITSKTRGIIGSQG